MADPETERVLHLLLAPELVAVAAGVALLSLDLFAGADVGPLRAIPRSVRLAAWVVLGSDLLAPAAVYLDMRRRGDGIDAVWLHAAALPVLNLVGVLAYLEDRARADRP